MQYDLVKKELQERVRDEINLIRDYEDEEIKEIIDRVIVENGRKYRLSLEEKTRLSKELFFGIRRLDILQELTEDSQVTEIMINGKDHIFVEKAGKLYEWEKKFESAEELEAQIRKDIARAKEYL